MTQQLTSQERDAELRASRNKYDLARRMWLDRVARGEAAGPFCPDWTSLMQHRAPRWYEEARWGISIHWGVLSVPGFAKFDAQAWARLCQQAGARYVAPLAEHHEGFAMYDSQLSDWTAAEIGPRRDVLGELRTAIVAEGLHFGLSSGARHKKPGANLDEELTGVIQGSLDDWLARSAELVARYEPELVYFPWSIGQPSFRNTVLRFLAYYYNQGASRGGVVVNYKGHAVAPGAGTDIEHGPFTDIQKRVWQTDTSISNESSGYIDNDTFKTPASIIHMLADVVSNNGNLMLNVGPRADGTIPDEAQDILRAIGAWLTVNGEAIYASKPWTRHGEGPTAVATGAFQDTKTKPYTAQDFRFTTRAGYLYAIELGWPERDEVLIRSIRPKMYVHEVRLLATGKAIPFNQTEEGLYLMLPKKRPGEHAWVYRIETSSLS